MRFSARWVTEGLSLCDLGEFQCILLRKGASGGLDLLRIGLWGRYMMLCYCSLLQEPDPKLFKLSMTDQICGTKKFAVLQLAIVDYNQESGRTPGHSKHSSGNAPASILLLGCLGATERQGSMAPGGHSPSLTSHATSRVLGAECLKPNSTLSGVIRVRGSLS